MGMLDCFRSVSNWSVNEVEAFLERHGPEEYNLVDVRQPKEYQEGHLPGAQMIPLDELERCQGGLDPQKTTITYCAAGVRIRAAASLFMEPAAAEVGHKATLQAFYEGLAGDFPLGVAPAMPEEAYMEGGMRVADAPEWLEGRHVRDILELAIAYDRYLMLRRELGDENSRRVFEVLSDEERRHLRKLTRLFDHLV